MTDDLPMIELFSEQFERDPFPMYAAARERSWIADCEMGKIVIAHDEVATLLRDSRLVMPGDALAMMLGAGGGPWHRWMSHIILGQTGEDHSRLRRLVAPSFTPRRADEARDMMRQVFRDTLDPLLSDGEFDLVQDLADEYPIRVLCKMIGIDEADVPTFKQWGHAMGQTFDMKPDVVAELDAAVGGIWDYVTEMLKEREKSSVRRDDLLQSLLEASEDGDRLTREELVNLVVTLLAGGTDTTSGQLAQIVYLLLTRRGQWDLLAADPSLVPAMVEEGMRVHPASASSPRMALEDISINGVDIPAGSFLLLAIAAANHDPSRYTDAEVFDVTRKDAGLQATFGMGPHFCLGANIARAELHVALDGLVRSIRAPQISGDVRWGNPLGVWAPKSLPVRFTAAEQPSHI